MDLILPVNCGFNSKLIVHKRFESLALIDHEHRSRSIAVYKKGWTAVTIWVPVRRLSPTEPYKNHNSSLVAYLVYPKHTLR